jgi:hypothetical protein
VDGVSSLLDKWLNASAFIARKAGGSTVGVELARYKRAQSGYEIGRFTATLSDGVI